MTKPCGAILIAAVSGRALARAAADARYVPLVVDFFADMDTQALAPALVQLPDLARGFRWRPLEGALETLAAHAPSPPVGLVYGSGFEDRPDILAQISKRWPLLGNDPATVSAVNDPARFFGALETHAIPHPETRLDRPADPRGWVVKRLGGAGGSHIAPAGRAHPPAKVYYQALVPGRSVSALFAANGQDARVLGFSEQWPSPTPAKPWRYGGAVRPARLSRKATGAMTATVFQLAAHFRLKGLNSADFMLDGEVPRLLEINPRPGATLDIFANDAAPLLAVHLDAVLHEALPERALVIEDASASGIVFAPDAITVPHETVWPDWAADLPQPGERIDKERPICTVLARGRSADEARCLVDTYRDRLLAELRASRTNPSAQEDYPAGEGSNR
ncbi:ATP-grasp domain-containing protein [Methyloceanibacter sp.]|uniref:ATP-grasp domain-containing protein n=1 Tax=Methyloceanibacter sp. TaxID=1965321 RepID=UPI002C89C8D0|nr:ATP-grasp domain-containing protein [Methyloceanibacter sp.]HML93524.1 ATP-grasp domain-containing protein [Methyloceanibacter sp.]